MKSILVAAVLLTAPTLYAAEGGAGGQKFAQRQAAAKQRFEQHQQTREANFEKKQQIKSDAHQQLAALREQKKAARAARGAKAAQ